MKHKLGDILLTSDMSDPHVVFLFKKHKGFHKLICIEYDPELTEYNVNNWFYSVEVAF